MSAAALPVLELRGVTVRFGAVAALSRVSAVLPAGEVTCVLGENGSGKSTLVALLSGLTRHTEGTLLVSGEPMRFRSPRQARAAGIATVWQDLAVAPLLSVWRNFFLGAEPTRGVGPFRRLDLDRARDTTVAALARVGVTGLDPDAPASTLRAGERQSLAIARALHFGARALVIDEPTTPLAVPQQTLVLQSIVTARSQGLAVLQVTNTPRYAHLVGDRFLLLAHGQVAGSLTRDDVDASDLTRLMAGGEEFTALTAALTALPPRAGGSLTEDGLSTATGMTRPAFRAYLATSGASVRTTSSHMAARSGPSSSRGRAWNRRAPTCISASSTARRFSNQSGSFGEPEPLPQTTRPAGVSR